MLDPAIMAALEAPPAPGLPHIVEERVWKSLDTSEFERATKRHLDGFERYADQWFAEVAKVKAELEYAPLGFPFSAENLSALDRAILDREEEAEDRAIEAARLEKRIGRDVKRMFTVNPSIGAAMRSAGGRLLEVEQRLIEGLLDLALFYRAMRAEGSPEAEGGETFDSPEALQRYLALQVGA